MPYKIVGKKRRCDPSCTITFSLPVSLFVLLEKEINKSGLNRSKFITGLIEQKINKSSKSKSKKRTVNK